MAQSGSDTDLGQSTSRPLELPPGWRYTHTKFVQDLAKKGEDAASVMILFETEFSDEKLGQPVKLGDAVKRIMTGTHRTPRSQ